MNPNLVTTIVPVYNREAMLREAVASVLAQTWRPIEIIIVDDGSTDTTPETLEEIASRQPEVRIVTRNNGGPGLARETGRLLARGEFIQHLDSDDVLLPRKFELQVTALRERPDAGAAYGWTRFRHRDGRIEPRPWKRSGEHIETMFPAMLQSRWWDTPTPLYRAELLARTGPWLPLQIEEDWEYDARVAAQHVPLAFVEQWVCEVREHGQAHASGHGLDPHRLSDRAVAHAAVYRHARHAGISGDVPEMRHFARELFLLSRQCGAAGLPGDSERLFKLAREASGAVANQLQFRTYAALARLLGWSVVGKLSVLADRVRPGADAETRPLKSRPK